MTSCHLQSSSTVTLHGGPVVLRPVRATFYFTYVICAVQNADNVTMFQIWSDDKHCIVYECAGNDIAK